jgi:hypothetical protein
VRVFDDATKHGVYEKANERGKGEEQIQLPAPCGWQRREQEQDLRSRRNGRRSRCSLEQGRRKLGRQLPNALRSPQSSQR